MFLSIAVKLSVAVGSTGHFRTTAEKIQFTGTFYQNNYMYGKRMQLYV